MIAKGFKGRYFSLAAIAATVSMVQLNAQAISYTEKNDSIYKKISIEEDDEISTVEIENIVVEAEGIKSDELSAASNYEVYTSKDIKNSKAVDLIEFLNRYTSVNVSSSFGNIFTPKIDFHGFGLDSGFENIVVSVNGKRFNNIDQLPQLLASIPIESVEKIEILKGSGSVIYGDGATAGVINIKTKPIDGIKYKIFKGNYKTLGTTVAAGLATDKAMGYFYIDSYRSKGFREISGDVPETRQKKLSNIFNISFYPNDDLEFIIEATNSTVHNYYANSLTKDQFEKDPKQEGNPNWKGLTYNYQILKDNSINYSLVYQINENLNLKLSYFDSKKTNSIFFKQNYNYNQYDFSLNYEKNGFNGVIGISDFEGDRTTSKNITSKENLGYFINLSKKFEKHRLTLGYRKERVKYEYNPKSGEKLNDKDKEYAFSAGYNYQLTNNSSIYFNFTRAFQFPDIDRFFTYDFTLRKYKFNEFIDTMKTKTYTFGYNNISNTQKFKISAFIINVKNEIFYNPLTFSNTNLDKTEKKGFDIEYRRKITDFLSGILNYSYILSKIKEDDIKDYEGKILPGVSKHNLTLSLNFNYNRFYSNISHIYRSSSFALEDFKNSFSQKQKPYNSTDVSLGYRIKKDLEIFAKITNLFKYKNGLWIRDDVIYPDNAVRSYYIGIKGSF